MEDPEGERRRMSDIGTLKKKVHSLTYPDPALNMCPPNNTEKNTSLFASNQIIKK